MAHVLGVSQDLGEKICHSKYSFDVDNTNLIADGTTVNSKYNTYICDADTKVIMADGNVPLITTRKFGKGMGIYMSGFHYGDINNRTLQNLILTGAGESIEQLYMTDNVYTECCYYPDGKQLVIINNSEKEETTTVKTEFGDKTVAIAGFDTKIIQL